jgi:hypothetical protein
MSPLLCTTGGGQDRPFNRERSWLYRVVDDGEVLGILEG